MSIFTVNNPVPSGSGSEKAKLPADLSPRVVELMQRLDRLPAGTYHIAVTKPEIRQQDWQVEIVRLEKIQHFRLSKYQPE